MSQQGSVGNVIAAGVNLFFPGLGQLLQGRVLPALLFFLITVGGYALWFLVVPAIIGAIAHLWSIIDAARYQPD